MKTSKAYICPSCQSPGISFFYQQVDVPVHSVILLETREQALQYPRGNIQLGLCQSCGFISNYAFDSHSQEYDSNQYEATQGYSSTFNAFHQRLATKLIERYDLQGKRILEIGCGQGEFLSLLCETGNNQGVGFDPAFVEGRSSSRIGNGIKFVKDFYSEKYIDQAADFFVCKMTLEHIHQTEEFMKTIRRAVAGSPNGTIFFQVPNARYVFGDIAFWDIYYEHCSYFSLGSIARLFRRTGFDVLELWADYDEQYLMIAAKPVENDERDKLPQEDDLDQIVEEISRFSSQYPQKLSAWRMKIKSMKDAGQKIILWGGGSKAVAFLTTLNIGLDAIEYVVDINPHKSGTYIAGMGQEIVTPEFLKNYQPDAVIVMNPVYRREIQESLKQMDLYPEMLTVHSI